MTSKERGGGGKFAAVTCTLVALFSSSIRKELSGVSASGQVLPKPSRPQRLKRFMVRGAVGAALLATCLQAGAASALTWNWSFNGGPLPSAQGTFTTAGSTAQANTFLTITGVTGTYTDLDGISRNITGLATYGRATNRFQWDGSNASPIITESFAGISFVLDLPPPPVDYGNLGEVVIYNGSFSPNPGRINVFASRYLPTFTIQSSLLSPVSAPSSAPVPGPIPLFGAAAAFGWSRQLRRRIKTPA